MKQALSEAAWALLAENDLSAITLADIAEAAEVPLDDAVIYGGDVTHLILGQLDHLDDASLRTSRDDFADDPHASIYEKLFEGLMMRFESLAPYRGQFDKLHQAAKTNPALAAHLVHHLSTTIGKLLYLAGDDATGFIKQARIMGVVGVLLRVRPIWSDDTSSDLGLTMKALDDGLKKACEWAVSLRILSQDDVAASQDGASGF
ncbi:MAG: hypothetical protein ACON4G_04160, partial [Candidatus Puniceispirillaceae bacterium]